MRLIRIPNCGAGVVHAFPVRKTDSGHMVPAKPPVSFNCAPTEISRVVKVGFTGGINVDGCLGSEGLGIKRCPFYNPPSK